MPWRGSTPPIAGLLSGASGPTTVNEFSIANVLTRALFRVTDAPSGGTVVIALNSQADGLGDEIEVTIADGDTFAQATGAISVGSIHQFIRSASGSALNLSGEYELNSVEGVTDEFTTLAKVHLDANIAATDADRDTVINSIIASVTAEMQRYMGRDIVQRTATDERIDSTGSHEISTREYPIIEIASLTEADSTLTEDTDFEAQEGDLARGRLVRISGGFPTGWAKGRRIVKTTYDHGFVTVPQDLVGVCTSEVVNRFFDTVQSAKARRGLTSQGVDPAGSVAFDKDFWAREVVPVLKRYRRLFA